MLEKRDRLSFITTILAGLAAHGYAMTNLLGSRDAAGIIRGVGHTLISGRWLLGIFQIVVEKLLGGAYSIPFFYILVSIGLVGLCSIVIIRMFQIQSKGIVIGISALMVTYPVFASTALYVYTLPYYMVALFFHVEAAYLATRNSMKAYIVALLLCTAGLGIYQAYLPVTATLLLLYLICQCMEAKSDKKLLGEIIRVGILLLGSAMLYIAFTKAVSYIWNITLNEYKGISTMGAFGLKEMLYRMALTYYYTIGYPFRNFHLINPNLLSKSCLVIMYGLFVMMGIHLLLLTRPRRRRFICLLLFMMAPLCFNMGYLMVSDKTYMNSMTVYSSIGVLLFPLVLFERYGKTLSIENDRMLAFPTRKIGMPPKKRCDLALGFKKGVLICTALLTAEYCWNDNGIYVANAYAIQQTEASTTALITRIVSADGYQTEMPVVIVGEIQNESFTNGQGLELFQVIGSPIDLPISESWSFQNYMKNHLGFLTELIRVEDVVDLSKELSLELKAVAAVKGMPSYPADGSVQVVGGYVIIKGVD